MLFGNMQEVVDWRDVVMSVDSKRKRAVCLSAGSGVVGLWVARNAVSHAWVGVSDFEDR